MSAFARELSRLRSTYSVLLRLRDKGDRSQWMTGASSRRKFSVNRAACMWDDSRRGRGFAISAINRQDVSEIKHTYGVENMYAHNLFLDSINYAKTVLQPSTTLAYVSKEEVLRLLRQDWSLMASEEALSAIKRLSYYIRYNEKSIDPLKFTEALNMLNLEKMTDDDLITMIRHLVPFRKLLQYDFYIPFCQRIDRQCVRRFMHLNTEKMLLLCDMIYQMFPINNSQYMWYAIRKLGNKPNRLTPQQLVQVLFFLNIYRKPSINMYELEYRLAQCIDDLSINELGIASLGFFKTGTQIRSLNFLKRIMMKTISEVENVDSVSIGAISKLIRYSMHLGEIDTFSNLIKTLIPHEPRFTLMSLLHIGHACTRIQLYDEEFIDRLIKRFSSELKTARMKDMERLIFVLSSLNIDPSNRIYQNVIDELRITWDTTRALEISTYPRIVPRILGYLAIPGIYSMDLIQRVMQPEYIHKTCYGNYRYLSREYCVLDYSLRVEVPEYKGPFLNLTTCNFLENKYFKEYYIPSQMSHLNVLTYAVLQTCQDLFHTTSDISVIRLLPHYMPPDIVFCLDECNQLVPSEKFLSQFEQSDIKHTDKESGKNIRWIALVMAHHGLLIRNSNSPCGQLAAKIRHLSIIGYTPIMISYTSWEEYNSSQEKCDYIRNLVFRNNALEMSNM